MKIIRPLVAVVTATVLAGTCACSGGGSGSGSGGSDPTSAAGSSSTSANASTAAGTSSAAGDSDSRKSQDVDRAKLLTDMADALRGTSVVGEGDLGGMGTMRMVADMRGKNPKSQGSFDLSGMTMKVIAVDEKVYFNMGDFSDNKYFVMAPDGPLAKQFAGVLESTDPGTIIKNQIDAVTSVTKKGEPTRINGVRAQAYDVRLDLTKVKGAQAESQRLSFEKLREQGADLPAEAVYTYWIDEKKRPVRIRFEVLGTKTSMDFTDWGVKTDIKAPPASELTDPPSILTQGARG